MPTVENVLFAGVALPWPLLGGTLVEPFGFAAPPAVVPAEQFVVLAVVDEPSDDRWTLKVVDELEPGVV